jgi:methionine aminopeptidase
MMEKLVFPEGLEEQPRTSPCEASCPAGNPIQKADALIQENRVEEALEYLRSRNPLPGITGRVCGHPCEENCNRNKYDEKLSIRGLERFAGDHADLTRVMKPQRKESSGKRLAIIGSGPNSVIIHYDINTRKMEAGDVVVMDVGAEYSEYAGDITRTIPVSGKFSPRRRIVSFFRSSTSKSALCGGTCSVFRPGSRPLPRERR